MRDKNASYLVISCLYVAERTLTSFKTHERNREKFLLSMRNDREFMTIRCFDTKLIKKRCRVYYRNEFEICYDADYVAL